MADIFPSWSDKCKSGVQLSSTTASASGSRILPDTGVHWPERPPSAPEMSQTQIFPFSLYPNIYVSQHQSCSLYTTGIIKRLYPPWKYTYFVVLGLAESTQTIQWQQNIHQRHHANLSPASVVIIVIFSEIERQIAISKDYALAMASRLSASARVRRRSLRSGTEDTNNQEIYIHTLSISGLYMELIRIQIVSAGVTTHEHPICRFHLNNREVGMRLDETEFEQVCVGDRENGNSLWKNHKTISANLNGAILGSPCYTEYFFLFALDKNKITKRSQVIIVSNEALHCLPHGDDTQCNVAKLCWGEFYSRSPRRFTWWWFTSPENERLLYVCTWLVRRSYGFFFPGLI